MQKLPAFSPFGLDPWGIWARRCCARYRVDSFNVALRPQRPCKLLEAGEPRASTSTVMQLLTVPISFQVQCCFTSTVTIRAVRDRELGTSTSTQLHSSLAVISFEVQCCFMSTMTIRTIRDRELRTSTSTFTQFLSSDIKSDQVKPSTSLFLSKENVGAILQ